MLEEKSCFHKLLFSNQEFNKEYFHSMQNLESIIIIY